MLKSRKIAVTGNLACGKSSVCRFFKEFGAEVVDADQIVHQLLDKDAAIGKKLVDILGEEIMIDGKISRQKIAEKVFQKPEPLERLEKLLHPAVHQEIEKRFQKCKAPLFVAEVPLLFESETHEDYDAIIVVVSDQGKKRFTGTSFEERLARQLPLEEKAVRGDYIIENNGSLEELKTKTRQLYEGLL